MNIKDKIRALYRAGRDSGESAFEIFVCNFLLRIVEKLFTRRISIKTATGKASVIHHVFFHSLVLDPEKAFRRGHDDEHSFEDWFVTRDEFRCFLQQVYDRGYVLVRMRDLLHRRVKLPPGKTPLIMSFDDMNYYDYMKGCGFAERLELDRQDDTVTVLEEFIKSHPGFSFKGARGIIALTGYEGALGYRDTSDPALTATVKELKKMGYEFACHSWGHHHRIYSDTAPNGRKGIIDMKKWFAGVGKAVGRTDIFITPFGVDIRNNPLLHEYLKLKGFRYFCSVGSTHRTECCGSCFYMERFHIDGISLRFNDYDYNAYYGSVKELYSDKRTVPYKPLSMDAPSLVKHGKFCMRIPNIYLWGAMGEVLSYGLIREIRDLFPEAYPLKKWMSFLPLSDGERRAFDCSGLIKNYLMGGVFAYEYNQEVDWNSDGLFEHSECTGDVENMPEIPGICLLMEGHVGIYAGNGMVIECTSNKKFGNGVVMTRLSDRVWLKWFYCPGIDYGGKQ